MSSVPIFIMGGSAYADIDVLACAAAYKQYLTLLGFQAYALITGPWNQTIPISVKEWEIDVEGEFLYQGKKCNFVLVDFSDPKFVDSFVDLNQVIEVFDHHHGYKEYWEDRIGDKAVIEMVGACATLIWEKFKAAKIEHEITTVNANLLYTAIFANTLDFKSAVTHERDRIAAKEIFPYTSLPLDWKNIYYKEVEAEFLQNALDKIKEDTKNITMFDKKFNFGQIELSHARDFLKSVDNLDILSSDFEENKAQAWIINIVSIQEGCSYVYCNCSMLLEQLKLILPVREVEQKSNGAQILTTQRLWLRKEILKGLMILEASQTTC